MKNSLLDELNRMRKLMNLTESEELDDNTDTLRKDPLGDAIMTSLKQQLGGDKEIYVRLIDNRPGKEGKNRIVKQTVNGEIISIDDDDPEEINEGIKDTLKIGAICYILASGSVSCKKSEDYDIGKDPRFRLKPSILNSLGKEYFDSPLQDKDKIYVMATNVTGSYDNNNARYLYYDFTNKVKKYGAATDYPDSASNVINGLAPIEVVQVIPFDTNMISKLQPYNKTGKPLGSFLGKYKNVVVVEVLGASHYDWSDPYNPKEVIDGKYKKGHAIYLTNLDGLNVGEVYPVLLDNLFGTYKNPTVGNDKVMSLDNYNINNFINLLGDKPEF